jgi:hypothetical protein
MHEALIAEVMMSRNKEPNENTCTLNERRDTPLSGATFPEKLGNAFYKVLNSKDDH